LVYVAAIIARKHKKTYLHLYAARADKAPERLARFVEDSKVQILNVAGPRASKEPHIAQFVIATLERAFGGWGTQENPDEMTKERAIKQNQAFQSFRLLNQQPKPQQLPGIDR
jgi:Circularly permutated YpsA SLOG family